MSDYIIIGSGHNALICAYYLSKRHSVRILERNRHFGGCIATDEITLPGFRHDLAAMNLNLFAGSPFFQEVQTELTNHGFELVPADKPCASVFPDGDYCAVFQDLEKTLSKIRQLSEKDAATWEKLNAQFFQQVEHILPVLSELMPSFAAARHLYRGVRKNGMPWLYDMARLFIASPREFVQRYFEHPKVQSMVCSWAMHLDFAPDVAGGALFSYLENFAGQNFGMALGKGGADSLSNALVSLLKARNVEFHNDCEVSEIIVEGGKAVGVKTLAGNSFEAKKGIVANCNPGNLFQKLVEPEALPEDFREQVGHFIPGVGTMVIHLALDELPNWKGGEVLREFAYIHIAPYMHDIAQAYTDCQRGFLPVQPFMIVGQPSVVDPSRAPEGKHVLWIQVRSVPYQILGDAAGEIEVGDWAQIKERYADRLISIIDGYCDGFRSHILARKVFSPKDLEQFNPNLAGGCNLSGSSHLQQNLFMRPIAGYSRYKTPVKKLYMVGASTWPGAGVGGGSGRLLGKMLA